MHLGRRSASSTVLVTEKWKQYDHGVASICNVIFLIIFCRSNISLRKKMALPQRIILKQHSLEAQHERDGGDDEYKISDSAPSHTANSR